MNKTIFIVSILICLAMLSSCKGPFDDEYYMRKHVPPQRTRTIERFDISKYQQEEKKDLTEAPDPPAKSIELSLEEARAAALENNLDLKVALLDPSIARETISEAEAQFEALLFTDLNWSKTDTPTASTLSGSQAESTSIQPGVRLPLTTGGLLQASVPMNETETNLLFSTLNPSYTADFQLLISQPLLRNAGPKVNTHAIRVAKYDSYITDARTKLQVMRILADVDRIYWQLYGARRALQVRQQEYELAQRQLERAKRRFEQGQDAEIEVFRAESGLAERLEGIIRDEFSVRGNQRALKLIMNRPDLPQDSPTVIIPTTPPNPVRFHLDGAGLADAAMDGRMELLEDELQIVKAMSEVDVARNQVLPLLNLDYIYNANGLGSSFGRAFDQLGDKNFEDHAIVLRAELPLGNQGARSALNRAILTRIQLAYNKDARRRLIRQEVLDAADAIETNWQRIVAAQQRTILAARTLEGEVRQFELGLRTSTDVLDAQAQLALAQLTEVDAITGYEITQVDLAVATGTLIGSAKVRWEPLEGDLD